ncbi:DNA mismatch repair mutS [Gossypium arboreum]|uniref:DNA mismatch repair mutS n=1 Tax=Gossypium arboreum TaxID=29729 RepID=A0A0B0MIB7_GOSAR|nr:DNA mismatch repair mutS [Gossypium arboreum]
MALMSYYKAKVPCKTMARHGIGEFIRQGYHVRPRQDMAMVSSKKKRFSSNPKSKSKKRQVENMKKEYKYAFKAYLILRL